jgi:uncharacterized protein (DUF58 family)
MNQPLALRSNAEALAGPLPALLADADKLASTVLLGDHGRRRAGMGDTFWQYRIAQPHDSAHSIDWRRSALSDTTFVQDKEWQIAQSVMMWIDQSASMRFASTDALPTKSHVAGLLGLAVSILLLRGGERVGLLGSDSLPRRGEAALIQMAQALSHDAEADYGIPTTRGLLPNSRALFVSDFLGDLATLETALFTAADRGVRGTLFQILDPQEEAFPFDGRTIFESMAGQLSHETLKARDLKDRYLERLAKRKDRLSELARSTGWQFHTHHTNLPSTSALLWLYQSFEGQH